MSFLAKLHEPIYKRRIEVLSKLICQQLQTQDRVLDVGCGNGTLAAAIQNHPQCPKNVTLSGAEKNPRGNEAIEVQAFDGYKIDAADNSWDVTILADVVHHEVDAMKLLREVARVTARTILIKDHKAEGFLSYQRICFMDWAANKPWGIPCLYRYYSAQKWQEICQEIGFEIDFELKSIDLYPFGWNQFFGKKLQYFAAAQKITPYK